MKSFKDGVMDVLSGLVNRRNAVSRNKVAIYHLDDEEMRTMYATGVMSKIIRLKAGYALNDTIQFSSKKDEEVYNRNLAPLVKKAFKYSLGFGRGVIVLFNKNDKLSNPLRNPDPDTLHARVFSGDMVKGNSPTFDLRSERYYKPMYYTVNGEQIHWTRVIDLTYFEPPERDKPNYNYGGISESQLVYDQFINDAVVQRAGPSIIEKASTFVYKITGYKDAIQRKQEGDIVKYVSTCEDGRSIYGALVTDANDSVETLTQSLADIDKVDNITLRRLAMVTGLSFTDLVGEQPSGMNADGSSEQKVTQDTIENMQSDYLLEPINVLASMYGMGPISFKENQGQTPGDRVNYDKKVVDVARVLWEMGEDASGYLEDKNLSKKDSWDDFFKADDNAEEKEAVETLGQFMGGDNGGV